MGGLTSKHVDDAINDVDFEGSPKPARTHFLTVDPRSPSEAITRTPIAVPTTPDPDNNGTPKGRKVMRTLALDPRSPSTQVKRTPIQVEEKDTQRQPVTRRPIRLAQLESVSSDSEANSTGSSDNSEETDPRSPTYKVPRTPLYNKEHHFRASEQFEQENLASREKEHEAKKEGTAEVATEHDSLTEKKNPTANGTNDKLRHPLSMVQNAGANTTPRGILQARQCRNVEEEYNKNQQVLLNQFMGQENTVSTNTQFVETI